MIFFRHILQKCSSIHKVLTALFASSDEKISTQSERVEHSEAPLGHLKNSRAVILTVFFVIFHKMLVNTQGINPAFCLYDERICTRSERVEHSEAPLGHL